MCFTHLGTLGDTLPRWPERGRGAPITGAEGLADECKVCDEASDEDCDDCEPAEGCSGYTSLESLGVWPPASIGWVIAGWPAVDEGRDCVGGDELLETWLPWFA